MKRTQPALVLLASVLMIVALGGCRQERERTGEEPPPQASRANFTTGHIRPVNPSDRPESQQTADAEAPKVVSLMNGVYTTAFLDRAKWSGGSHPGLAEFFTAEAGASIGPNLGALALADLAPRIEGLNPAKQELPRISFFIEDDLSVPFGVVTAVFEAKATPTKGKTPVAVVHNANFWVVKEGDGYKIYAYTSELRVDSQTKSAAFGNRPGESVG